MERIQKIIANAGITSRRKAEDLITQGHVTVNGKRAQLGESADPQHDDIRVKGQSVIARTHHVYYALNKPVGYISSASDEKGRATILDLLPDKPRVFPVGRLDRDSQGLILLTNDGSFANRISHPKYRIKKTYDVILDRDITEQDIEKLKKGLRIDYKKIVPDSIRHPHKNHLIITIHSGQNRVIRRLMKLLGYKVTRLTRTHIGSLAMGKLPLEHYKELTSKDLEKITAQH